MRRMGSLGTEPVIPAVGAVLVGIAGLRPALALVQVRWLAALVAPLVAGLLASIAGMIAVATGTNQFLWWVVLVAVANICTLREHLDWRLPSVNAWIVVASLLVVAAAAYPLIDMTVRNVGWDGRSIWLLHSRWFFAGGDYARAAMQNPVYLFSHPDYPPLVPATVATVWSMSGAIDLRVGQIVITVLNATVVALVGLGFVRLVRGRLVIAAGAIGAGVCLTAYLFADGYEINAYADVLAAASTTAAALYLLVLPPGRAHAMVGLLCGAVAGSTKNEAVPVVVGVLVLSAFRHRETLRAWLPAGVVVVALFGAWGLVTHGVGVRSDLLGGPVPRGALLARTHDAGDRAAQSLRKIGSVCGGLGALTLGCSLGGLVAARRRRCQLHVGATFWLWGVTGLSLAALVGAYVLSPYDLAWHLRTSLYRTTITPRLLLTCEVGVWIVCSMSFLLQDRTPSFRRKPALKESHDSAIRLPSRKPGGAAGDRTPHDPDGVDTVTVPSPVLGKSQGTRNTS